MGPGVARPELLWLEVFHTGLDIGLSDDDLLIARRSESPGVKYAAYEMKVEDRNMGTLINRPTTEPG